MGALAQLLQCSRPSTAPPLLAFTTRLPSSTPRCAPSTSRARTPTTRPTTPPPTTTGSVPAPTGTTSTTAPRSLADDGWRVNDHIKSQTHAAYSEPVLHESTKQFTPKWP